MNSHNAGKHKKLLLLGSSLGTMEILRYAQKKGIYVIVTDYLPPETSLAKREADEYWMINTSDVDKLETKCREEEVTAIFCGVSEFNLERTMELCDRLSLPFYADKEAWRYSRDKRLFKRLCQKKQVPIAKDYFIYDITDKEKLAEVQYPVVVKPVDLSGNLGVSYCKNESELIEAYKKVRLISDNPEIIVEKMLHGEEWHGYYAIANGEIRLVALNAMYAQPGKPSNCYSITTTATNHVEQYVNEISPLVENVLAEAGCKEGIAWVQVMLDEDGCFYVIEMGYRLTGECIFIPYRDLVGFDSIGWLVDFSLGNAHTSAELPDAQKTAYRKCACAYMLWSDKAGTIGSFEGVKEVSEMPGITIDLLVYVGKEIDEYRPMGTILFTSEDCDEMCSTLYEINKRIQVRDVDGNDMLIKYDNYQYLKQVYNEGRKGR